MTSGLERGLGGSLGEIDTLGHLLADRLPCCIGAVRQLLEG